MHRHGLVVGTLAPCHRGHRLLVETAPAECRQVTLPVDANPDVPAMPQARRAGWIRAIHPGLRVLAPTGAPPDASDDRTHRDFAAAFLGRHGLVPDAVLTSEGYGEGFAAHLGARHRSVDPGRRAVPVSGTLLRADPAAHARVLHPIVARALGVPEP